jgi:hypothetical protein
MVAQKCVDPSKIEDRQMATMVVKKRDQTATASD